MAKGVRERHARKCRSPKGGRCSCEPSFQAYVTGPGGKQIFKKFDNRSEAEGWRRDAIRAIKRGRPVRQPKQTLKEGCDQWLAQIKAGQVLSRAGHAYKPATIRAYEVALRERIYPELGDVPVDELARIDIQESVVDKMVGDGWKASTIHQPATTLRAFYRYLIERDRVKVSPTVGIKLPAIENGRERVADPVEAAQLLAAISEDDRPIWATAFYAGLRRGELMALRCNALDLEANEVHVLAGWDQDAGEQPTKGRERRKVKLIPDLRAMLAKHLMATGRRGDDLVFGETASEPFTPGKLLYHADAAFTANGLNRITLHECRHTYASLMIAAGANIGTVSISMGHSSVTVTWDRYHHLMPGTMDDAADLMQAYLDKKRAVS